MSISEITSQKLLLNQKMQQTEAESVEQRTRLQELEKNREQLQADLQTKNQELESIGDQMREKSSQMAIQQEQHRE